MMIMVACSRMMMDAHLVNYRSKMTTFNKHNTAHKEGSSPLFMGQQLGVIDTINVTHPVFEELYQTQLSQMWNEFEVSLTQDKMDMLLMPEHTVDIMVKTIMWQHAADSVASRSIIECLGDYITNSEFHDYATIWSFFETVHGRTYSHIIKQTFTQPNDALEELYSNMQVMQRNKILVDTFDELKALPDTASERTKVKAIIKVVVALFALEAIAFMGSFAITFGIGETGKFQGITQLVKLICRDEVLHSKGGFNIINIIKKELGQYYNEPDIQDDIKHILDEVVQQELRWAEYIFSEGQIVGLSEGMLKQYIIYMSAPVYKACGVPFDLAVFGSVPTSNPLPYMDKYIDSKKMQAAPQEIEITSYKTNSIIDDTDDIDFD